MQLDGVHVSLMGVRPVGDQRFPRMGMARFVLLCTSAYGMVAPGTRWDDIPDDWSCPDCGAAKSDFEMVEVARP